MDKFGFSVIIPTHNSELGIKKSIDSVINQTYNFDDIEILIVDYNSNDNTKRICEEYIEKYPNNIKFFNTDNFNFINTINTVIHNSAAHFLTFLQAHDYYSKDAFKNVSNFIGKNENVDLISIPIIYFKNNRTEHYLKYKIKKTEQINLLEQPEYAQLLGLSTFIKKDSLTNLEVLDIPNTSITLFSEILTKNPKLGIIKSGSYFSNNIDEKLQPPKDALFNLSDYNKFVDYNFDNLIGKCLNQFSDVPQFIQLNLINHFRWILTIEKIPEKLDLSRLSEIAKYIDDELILNNKLLEREQKIFLLLLKHDYDLKDDLKEKLELNTIFIDNYDIINNNLKILASKLATTPNDVDIFVNGKKVTKNELRFPQKDKYILNNKYAQDYSIEATIPLTTDDTFNLQFRSEGEKLHIDFSRPCNFSKDVGYAKTKHYLSVLENDTINIKKKTSLKWIKQELKSLMNMVKQHKPGFEKAIPFRIAYMISYPLLKNRRIWFYMDRPTESDDNGLALFKYSVKKEEGIDKYFILDSKNKDFKDIEKIGKVIPYKSLRHRFLGMFVENIITSHPDNEIIYPFWGGYPFFAGLLKSNTMFLQHGILKDNISSWLNKSNMNLSFFLVSSTDEYNSIFTYPYNYDEGVVQLLGLPRYDTLENQNDKKEIIITPSWRRNLDHKSKEFVKESEFFKIFNSLINNDKLIKKAKEYDYEIIFRPHPKVYEFIDLFDENSYVKIDYDKVKYQTLFNNGSIMITDYSSVAFDFAYLKKPIIYYQYASDYHFDLDESFFDYETMGFGEIVKTEEALVNLIIEYMENDCKTKDKYYKRMSEFFIFNDKDNCKRVHDKIKEVPLKD